MGSKAARLVKSIGQATVQLRWHRSRNPGIRLVESWQAATVLANARRKTASDLVDRMPQQDVVIRPEAGFEEAAGVSSHFVTDPDPTRPGIFYIQLNGWASLSRGEAEITVVHEAWPGHALQKSLARELQPAVVLMDCFLPGMNGLQVRQ